MEVPKFNVTVSDDYNNEENIFTTSLVDDPATQKLFAVFSKEGKAKNLNFKYDFPSDPNEQKVKKGGNFERIISGVWFMPDTDYLREQGGMMFTTSITRDELKKAVTNFMKSGAQESFNIMHDGKPVKGLKTLEVWILDEYSQKSPILNNTIEDLGYDKNSVPLGSVFMSVFVENEQFFKKHILSGELKGFSIEAFFNLESKFNNQSSMKQKEMFGAMGLNQETGSVITQQGELKFSNEEITLDGKSLASGDFKLKTGFSIVVRNGVVAEFGYEDQTPPATETPATEQPATQSLTQDQIDEMVSKAVAANEAKKAEQAAAKAAEEKAAADAARLAELEAENEQLKKSRLVANSKPQAKPSEDQMSNFRVVVLGGETHYVPK